MAKQEEILPIRLLIIFILLSLILIFADQLQLINIPKYAIQTVTLPIQQVIFNIGKTALGELNQFKSIKNLYQDNLSLRSENNLLKAEITQLQTVEEENKILKSQFEKLSPRTFNLLPVAVVGWGDTLIIGAGQDSKIEIGQVVVQGDLLVGTVSLVSPKLSQIKTIFHPDSKIPVVIRHRQTGRQSFGQLVSRFGHNLELQEVSQQAPLATGDIIVTAGSDDLPKGLVVGEVDKVVRDETAIFQTGQVKAYFDALSASIVFVSIDK